MNNNKAAELAAELATKAIEVLQKDGMKAFNEFVKKSHEEMAKLDEADQTFEGTIKEFPSEDLKDRLEQTSEIMKKAIFLGVDEKKYLPTVILEVIASLVESGAYSPKEWAVIVETGLPQVIAAKKASVGE